MARLTLDELAQEIEVFREMGVFFTILSDGSVSFDCSPRALPCHQAVRAFSAEHEDMLRLYIANNGDQKALRRLDFYRWLAEHERWGRFPGLRVVPLTRRAHEKRTEKQPQ